MVTVASAERKIKNLQKRRYSLRNTYNSKSEAKNLIKNLKKWGYKVSTVVFPNGVTMVYYRR